MCAAHLLCRQLIELSLFVLELPPHSLQLSISLCLQCDAERDTQAMKASVSNLCLSPRQSVSQSVSQSVRVCGSALSCTPSNPQALSGVSPSQLRFRPCSPSAPPTASPALSWQSLAQLAPITWHRMISIGWLMESHSRPWQRRGSSGFSTVRKGVGCSAVRQALSVAWRGTHLHGPFARTIRHLLLVLILHRLLLPLQSSCTRRTRRLAYADCATALAQAGVRANGRACVLSILVPPDLPFRASRFALRSAACFLARACCVSWYSRTMATFAASSFACRPQCVSARIMVAHRVTQNKR
jgi:hypothetical protein